MEMCCRWVGDWEEGVIFGQKVHGVSVAIGLVVWFEKSKQNKQEECGRET